MGKGITITIDMDDFWMDADSDFEESFKRYIVDQATYNVFENVKKNLLKDIYPEVEKNVNKKVEEFMHDFIEQNADKLEMKVGYGQTVPLEKGVRSILSNKAENYAMTSITKLVEAYAKSFVDDLRKRYDLLFASQVITKLNENKMLKEGVFESLMGINDKK